MLRNEERDGLRDGVNLWSQLDAVVLLQHSGEREKKKLQSKGHILKQTICSGLITMTSWWWSQSMKDRKWKWNKNFDYDRHLCLLTQSVHETRVIASVRGQNELLTAVVSLTQGFVTSQILLKVSKYFFASRGRPRTGWGPYITL